jgi:hypothetical protein
MARNSEFAVRLRELRAAAGNPTQKAIAGVVLCSPAVVGDALRGTRVSWRIAAAIIGCLDGNPAEFRDAWERSRMPSGLRAQEPGMPDLRDFRDLLARFDRLGDEFRDYLERVTPDMLVPALPPGRLAEYRITGGSGRGVSVWHASAECLKQSSGIAHDLAEALEWVLEHEQEGHGGGS